MITVRITHLNQHAGTCHVEKDGVTHSCRWSTNERVYNVQGDEDLLRAALTAWDGPDTFQLTEAELKQRGGGWF